MKGRSCFTFSLLSALVLLLICTGFSYCQNGENAAELLRQGDALTSQARFKEALPYYQRGLALCEKNHDFKASWIFLSKMGNLYGCLGDFTTSLDYYLKSLELSEKIKEEPLRGASLTNAGLMYHNLGRYQEALESYDRALKIFLETGDRFSTGKVYGMTGLVRYSLCQYSRALECQQKSLTIADELGDRELRAQSLGDAAPCHARLGNFQQAYQCYKSALEIREKDGDTWNLGRLTCGLGTLYSQWSYYTEALECFEKARKESLECGDRSNLWNVNSGLGHAYINLGKPEKALEYYEGARALSVEMGDLKGQGIALNDIGFVQFILHDYRKAIDCFANALRIAHQAKDEGAQVSAYRNLAELCHYIRDYRRALEFLEKALQLSRESGARGDEIILLNLMGTVYRSTGEYEKAFDSYEKAWKLALSLNDQRKAYETLYGQGLTFMATGNDDQAIVFLQMAVVALEACKGRLGIEEYEIGFMSNKMDVYEKLVQLLLKKGKYRDAWHFAERSRAKTFLEMLESEKIDFRAYGSPESVRREKQINGEILRLSEDIEEEKDENKRRELIRALEVKKKEYEDIIAALKRSNPEYLALRKVEIVSLENIQASIDGDTCVLEYYVTGDRSYLFLIEKDRFEVVSIPAGEEELKKAVIALRRKIVTRSDCREDVKALSRVLFPSQTLIRLKRAGRLVFIPHSVLHYVPFCMLVDDHGKYLVKGHEILNEPSASVWKLCMDKKRPQVAGIVAYALGGSEGAFGIAREGGIRTLDLISPERSEIGPLPATADEVREISSLYPGGTALIGPEMTSDRVRSTIKGKNIVHFATHGILSPDYPLLSGLLLYDGLMTIPDIFSLDLSASLVVLSACNTGVGKLSSGDEIVGMARAFMYAGSSTVISTLWSVSDESTAKLMKRFYENLKTGSPEGRALQYAQKALMDEYADPFYWAPFTVTGKSGGQ